MASRRLLLEKRNNKKKKLLKLLRRILGAFESDGDTFKSTIKPEKK